MPRKNANITSIWCRRKDTQFRKDPGFWFKVNLQFTDAIMTITSLNFQSACLPVKGKGRTTPLRIQWEYTQEDRSSCKRAGPVLGTGYASMPPMPHGYTSMWHYCHLRWEKLQQNLVKDIKESVQSPWALAEKPLLASLTLQPPFPEAELLPRDTQTLCREDKMCLLTDQYLAQHHTLKGRSLTWEASGNARFQDSVPTSTWRQCT